MASLVITVTVESDMTGGAVQARTTLRNLEGARRLQRLCDRFGVPPTWLLSYPVVTGPDGHRFVGAAAEGRAEVGAYFQPWTTPPFDAHEDRLRPVAPGSLSSSAVEGKLTRLTQAFDHHLGMRPRCHRAAAAGLGGPTLQALERLDYSVDTTATPFIDARPGGGTDWRDAPEVPWFPDRQRAEVRGASPILEVPVSTGWDRPLPEFVQRGIARAPHAIRRLVGRPHLGGTRLMQLDPVVESSETLCRFATVLVERGLPCLNLALRSPELVAGESARCGTSAAVEAVFARLEDLLRHVVDQLRVTPRTTSDFGAWYLNETAG